MDNKLSIPPKERPEWRQIVSPGSEFRFDNFTLQMKSADYAKKLTKGEITTQQAINELHELCSKYTLAVQTDMKRIFKSW